MQVEYINPFIESVYDLFARMLDSKVTRGNAGVAKDVVTPRDVMALIGLSGPARGTVALSFPITTALSMVSQLLGTPMRIMDETVTDGVAEIVNMIAGGAKAKLFKEGEPPIDLSLPTVVRGNGFSIDYPSDTVWLEIPFTSDLGHFSIRVTFNFNNKKKGDR